MRLQVGLYAVYLLDWLTVFNKEQFLILRLEDHASNVKYTMHRVFQFLNLGTCHASGSGAPHKPQEHELSHLCVFVVCVYICLHLCVLVCVCVWVYERERERERGRERERVYLVVI